MRLAISTGGGDAPGLNAVIRAATLSAIARGWTVLGIKRGYAGLLGDDEVIPLTADSVRGIAHLGGTILRTTNRGNPFSFPRQQPDGSWKDFDRSDELIDNARNLGIQAMISIGGDGSLSIAQKLVEKGMRIVRAEDDRQRRVSTVTVFGFGHGVQTAIRRSTSCIRPPRAMTDGAQGDGRRGFIARIRACRIAPMC
jgi:6-phosphofructokinase 1